MGPPRRNDQGKSPKKATNGQQNQQPPQPPPSQPTQSAPSLGMTTAARYQHNLNVMRRRDPSIQTIFDQFDHVCIYLQEEGGKWQKIGVEGSLFLFESNTYPPYGFYVLNRAGSSDYIQRLYPEDEYGAIGEIIGIKSYPEFTLKRMAELRAANGDQPLSDPFSSAYKIPVLTPAMKGEKRTIGVWRHPESEVPQNREKMLDVIKRLYGCVRRHEPYPEEFRYGPNHPPPPHRLRAATKRRGEDDSSQSDTGASDAPSNSEIDALFSKFIPSAPKTPVKTPLDSLFAKLSTSDGAVHSAPVTPAPASTGNSLLDSIFASASKSQASLPLPIHSPTPSISTTPQVLNQDVISTLLGLAPSRTASAASNTHSAGGTSRDGDNEEDSDSSGGRSVPPTGGFLTVPEQGKVKGDATPRGFTTKSIPINGQTRVQAPPVLESVSSIATVRPSYPANRSSSSTVTLSTNGNAPVASEKAKPRANRELVPFEDDSVLWPYTPARNGDAGSDDPDIVELDFSDTSLLSDPDGFKKLKQQAPLRAQANTNGPAQSKEKRNRNRKKTKKERDAEERADIESSWDVPEYCSSYVASQRAAAEARKHLLNSPPASPSPPPSPPSSSASPAEVTRTPPRAQENCYGHQHQASMDAQTPTMGPRKIPPVNGRSVAPAPSTPSKAKKVAVNGATSAVAGLVDRGLVQSTIVDEVQAQSRNFGKLERNDFVREVLTLIHTDKSFVDGLYQRYNSQLA